MEKMKKPIIVNSGIVDSYSIRSEGMDAVVQILNDENKARIYTIISPEFTMPTKALMDELKRELVSEMSFSVQEVLDMNVINELKEKLRSKTIELLKKHLPNIDENAKIYMIGTLIHEMLGIGEIEFMLSDPQLEEIRINSAAENIKVYHKRYGWLETNKKIDSEADIQNYSDIIARRIGKQVNVLNPLLDAHLITGDRVNVVLYPITTKGNTLTIRKFARDPWTITDFINTKTVSSELMSLIWLAIEYEMNVIVSGGTGSGKTSFLNICMPFIPPNHSIVSIEDTRELQLPKYLYWTPMVTRLAGADGKGEITMLDLLVNSLRMRPDRIVMGEIRRKREAEVLFEAMHTGHSVYSTLHADSLSETASRLVNPPIDVPKNLLETVDLCVVMFRDRRKNIRRLYQAGEFIVEGEGQNASININMLYRWDPVKDTIAPHSKSLKLFEELNRHTGMTQKEINDDLLTKKSILDWLVKNNIRQIDEVGKIMNEYYLDRDSVVNMVKKNMSKGKIVKK
ncbi:MAG: ATPase, T2SS/T4P/T4SS family [Candidatus Woesearchaeota archaeon]|nr:ATPase, T2SS/T4P/T4SS family [Candidatus Woesearchaeota archaeon]